MRTVSAIGWTAAVLVHTASVLPGRVGTAAGSLKQNGYLHPASFFVGYARDEHYPVAEGAEDLWVQEMAGLLGACSRRVAEGWSPPRGAVTA